MVEWEYLKGCESQRPDQAAVTFLSGSDTKVLQVTQLYNTYCKNTAYQQFQEIYNVTLTYESKAPQATKEKFDFIDIGHNGINYPKQHPDAHISLKEWLQWKKIDKP